MTKDAMSDASDPKFILRQIWNWLPAFRAVAETQHLPTASKQLHVSASSLSRTIGLIESRLGHVLFVRKKGRLVLNDRGKSLLETMNKAEQALWNSVDQMSHGAHQQSLIVSAVGVLTNHSVLEAVLELIGQNARLVPYLTHHRPSRANELLVRGDLDVAFYFDAVEHDGVSIKAIGHYGSAIYCGKGHPLFAQKKVTQGDILAHPFSVPERGEHGLPIDHWPIALKRIEALRITLLSTNLEVALSGKFLVVLPDTLAERYVKLGLLRALTAIAIDPTDVFAAYASAREDDPVIRALVNDVQRRLSA